MFKKKRKTTMADMPNPEEHLAERPDAQEQQARADELTHASEAAAEHSFQEPDNALVAELDRSRAELSGLNDKHLRLLADFDNFRKRSAKERSDLLLFASENALKNMLPVLDDMERAIRNNANATDIASVKEGFALIQQKMLHILGSQGVKPMDDVKGQPFDVDKHEAITKAPAPTPDLKGKVLDVVENGYVLHDKVIRYAKVVVGE